MVMASARVDRGGSASPRRAHGGLVYLHGVGGARQDWYRPLADAVGGLTLDHVAPAFDDLLTTSGSVHARRQPTVTQDTVATDHARHAYRARQARLADLVAGCVLLSSALTRSVATSTTRPDARRSCTA